MSKKGYKKQLPVVLPPTARPPSMPAPRRSPELGEPSRPVVPAPPDLEVAATPVRQRRSRASIIGISAIVLINLAAAGFLVFVLTSATSDTPERGLPPNVAAPDPPRLLARRESYVETKVLPNGEVAVRQWIRAGEPIDQLSLALPSIAGMADLAATDVQVTAEGQPVDGPASISGRRVTYSFDPTVNLQVSYLLSGAVKRSSSAAGRALAMATTLDVTYAPRAEQETRVVRAPEVLSLACSSSPQEPPVPCGADYGDGQWRVELTGADVVDRVTAVLTIG